MVRVPDKLIGIYSRVTDTLEVTQGKDYLCGTVKTSPNKNYSVVFHDGHEEVLETSKWISGIVCLIENDNLLWLKEFDRPLNAVVSDNGRVVVLHTYDKDYSNMSSTPKEFVDLDSTLTVMEKSGETLMTREFGSNIYGCAMSPDADLVSLCTAFPDNSIYCFQMQERSLLWKYKYHDRKSGPDRLEFNANEIIVFAEYLTPTYQRKYVLGLDGILLPEYQMELETIRKIRKQRPQERANSLLARVKSEIRREILEGLIELESFVKTKGSFTHYPSIVDALEYHLRVESDMFELIWRVARQIMKKDPNILNPIAPTIVSRLKNISEISDSEVLVRFGELGGANPAWVKNEMQFIKNKLRSKVWSERRSAAIAIGSIGSADPSLVKDSIPILIEFASEPENVKNEMDTLNGPNFGVIYSGVDDATLLRESCVDAIGKIGSRFPESVNTAIPLLEKLSNDAPSPYTVKKATQALEGIRGNT